MSILKMPVCMITGLGEGTGGHTARRFAKAGYRIAMLARTEERLRKFEKELPGSRGYVCDISDLKHLIFLSLLLHTLLIIIRDHQVF